MGINHKAIRNTLKFVVLTAFIASIMWRLYNIMKHGGSLEQKSNETESDVEDSPYPAPTQTNEEARIFTK